MVEATIALTDRLGLQVVAEGIETEAVRQHLTSARCHRGQGWLLGPAVPGAALFRLLDLPGHSAAVA